MSLRLLPALLVLAAVPARQTPAAPSSSPPSPEANPIGFSYHLPDDWEIIGPKTPSPKEQKKQQQKVSSADEKRGIECLQVALTARHGDPPTTIVIVSLPFDCYGQTLTNRDLPGFGSGASEGLKQAFDIASPIEASYPLASHKMWIERASATPKGKSGPAYTVEIACTLLQKGVVCWMAQAADENGLHTFESAPVSLDGSPAPALVPPEIFLSHR
jgi:hypothetical protein